MSGPRNLIDKLNPQPWSLRRKIVTGASGTVVAAVIVSSATFGPLLFSPSSASTPTEPGVIVSVTPTPSSTPENATPTPTPSDTPSEAAVPAPSVPTPASPQVPVQQPPAAPVAPQPPEPVKCPEGTVPGAVDDYGNESNCAPPCQAYDDNNVCTSPGTGAFLYRVRESIEMAA